MLKFLKSSKCLCILLGLGLILSTYSVAMAAENSLKTVAKRLLQDVAQNLVPKESSKAVRKEGSGYEAYYYGINPAEFTTEVRDADGNHKTGFIRYKQYEYVCKGATKAEALKAPCRVKGSKNILEMLAYANGKWMYQ